MRKRGEAEAQRGWPIFRNGSVLEEKKLRCRNGKRKDEEKMKKLAMWLAVLFCLLCAQAWAEEGKIPYWAEESKALASILSYVETVTQEETEGYVPPQERIAVFDFDGTLYGELFPTYFDVSLLIHRVLHDSSYEAPQDVKEFASALEEAAKKHLPEPDLPRSAGQTSAESFAGMTVEEYRAYVRRFMDEPAYGFEGMTYAQGFYRPMVELVRFLAERDFKVFISSGSERNMVRELMKDELGEWIPPERVIGSTFVLKASGQGEKSGRSYTLKAEDTVFLEGNMEVKNQKTNKVFSIVNEIGAVPILVFGNSSGDLAMGQYALQHGGKGYMLLCDDTERDYGRPEVAASFAESCASIGLETISMRDDFAAIYGEEAVKTETEEEPAQGQEELAPAA